MNLLITGSRKGFQSPEERGFALVPISLLVDEAGINRREISEVVHGCARGVDMHAERWARQRKIKHTKFTANWAEHGPYAGNLRNQAMVDYCLTLPGETICLAFPGPDSKGTNDCINRATEAGIYTIILYCGA